MINLNQEWCTYRTAHPCGVFYEGKGKTALVHSGKYTGSGIRYKLARSFTGIDQSLWTTSILETFATEDQAYAAEAILVPIESLADPQRLNMNAGGLVGKYSNHSKLYKMMCGAKKKQSREARALRAKMNKQAQADKIRALKKELKENKNGNKQPK